MKNWSKILMGVLLIAIVVVQVDTWRIRHEIKSYDRAIDTVNIGTTANDGTGDPLRTAFAKINDVIIMLDSLDMELLTNDEMQALKDTEDLTDAVLFHVGDTTVTAAVGKVVFKTSDAHFYGCVATSGKKWKQLDN